MGTPTETTIPDNQLESIHGQYESLLDEIDNRADDSHERDTLQFLADLHHDQIGAELLTGRSTESFINYLEDCKSQIENYLDSGKYGLTIHPLSKSDSSTDSKDYGLILTCDEMPFLIDSLEVYLEDELGSVRHSAYESLNGALDSGELKQLEPGGESSFKFCAFFMDRKIADLRDEILGEVESILEQINLAVKDFNGMLETLENIGQQYQGSDSADALIDFLLDENFVFLGSSSIEQHDVSTDGDSGSLERTQLLGICKRDDFQIEQDLLEEIRDYQDKHELELLVTKINQKSVVYRRERLDCVSIRSNGTITNFIGLFTNKVLSKPATSIPLLDEKFNQIAEEQQLKEHTHRYRDIHSLFNDMPKDLLFTNTAEDILSDIQRINAVRGNRNFVMRTRSHPLELGVSVMIVMRKDRFSSEVRKALQQELKREYSADRIDHTLTMGSSKTARIHFHIVTERRSPERSPEELESHLHNLTKDWKDYLEESVRNAFEDHPEDVAPIYRDIFPDDYRTQVEPELALNDIANLEELRSGESDPPLLDLVNDPNKDHTHLIIYHDEKIILNEIMSLLSNHGFRVIEQSTFEVNINETTYFLHRYSLTDEDGAQLPLKEQKDLILRSLKSVYDGIQRDDSLNRLVMQEGLSPRFLNLFRLYKNYYHQLQLATKLESINRTLIQHSHIVRKLQEYFDVKFNPDRFEDRSERESELKRIEEEIESLIGKVKDRNCFQILSALLNKMKATVRTNFYQERSATSPGPEDPPASQYTNGKTHISVKIESQRVDAMPEPRPLYEIFVYSPLMEAVHLRSGPISRGGIRWSDRRDDYRTEVLGLMKTQKVKNALIVPEGAKGGFILKEEYLDPEKDRLQHGREQYTVFMEGLLDLTDNRSNGEIHPPDRVVRYDGDDPYLVVAADKGTAEFSDLANSIARDYDYWLDDAFASGGSVGYDHKELGITAKGGWECVKRHFREMDKNIQEEPFTVTGIGDMGGDVFGNGMILSDKIKLVAAFNHRSIFIDPDPDPERSFEERKRLFNAEQSAWTEYDESLISDGGGVYRRDANTISLDDPAIELLDLDREELPPDDLIRAILEADVDLLWNGGIGTYIKSSDESHAEVGDPQNDAFRADADRVQASVIGEGGNLGITQKGRIELDRNGVRLNTDFIDNSGGVDLSDHEVNLKILLQEAIKNGSLNPDDREEYLMNFADHFVDEVIMDNYEQSGAISLDYRNSNERIDDFRHLLDHLEESVNLNRNVEDLPDERELQERKRANEGITRPELAVILSYSKMDLYRKALENNWPNATIIGPFIERYFPDEVIEDLPEALNQHPLRKEIALTTLVNHAVDTAGCTTFHRLQEELGVDLITILKSYYTADYLANGESIRRRLFSLDNEISASDQYDAWRTIVDRLAHSVTWFVDSVKESPVFKGFLEQMNTSLNDHFNTILDKLRPRQEEYFRGNIQHWLNHGLDEKLAEDIAKISYLVPALEILMIARDRDDETVESLAELYFRLGNTLNIDWIIGQIFEQGTTSRWDQFAFRTLAIEVHDLQRQIIQRLLEEGKTLKEFTDQNQKTVSRLNDVQETLEQENVKEFSAFQYMVQRMRSLL